MIMIFTMHALYLMLGDHASMKIGILDNENIRLFYVNQTLPFDATLTISILTMHTWTYAA